MHLILPFLLASTTLAAPSRSLAARQIWGPCSDSGVHVIVTGGSGPPGTDPYDMGLLRTLAQSILDAEPGSSNTSVPYDKGNINSDPKGITAEATQTLNQYITDYNFVCPNSKIALLGYSSGGVATMNGLCHGVIGQYFAGNTSKFGFEDALTPVVAAVVYGEETRAPYAPYNQGTCVDGGGRAPRADPWSCGSFVPLIQSFCNDQDPDCCGGDVQDAHYTYPSEYDGVATQYVVDQLNRF